MSSIRTVADRPSEVTVSTEGLVVGYGKGRGNTHGLKGFTASFRPGITGLVGPNGAGKSTFLRSVMGLLSPRSGRLRVQGVPPAAYLFRHGVGFLPENPVLPGYLTVEEFLGGLSSRGPRGVPRPSEDASGPLAWEEGLGPLLPRPLSSLSLGQKKKVALAASLLDGPELLLLDEPTNGLDPMALEDLRRTLLSERRRGATIIVSSHHLDELQRISDALVFVDDGWNAGSWDRGRALERFGSLEALFHHVFRNDSGRTP